VEKPYVDLNPGARILMGPGPSDCPSRVLKAMATPLIGHLDPDFLDIMDETQELLRWLLRTKNRLTIPVSGTGSAGMEACFVNVVEPGDEVVVCVNGVFGTRMCDIVERIGGKLVRVDAPWGEIVPPEKVKEALGKCSKPKVVAIVHAETSTGVRQPVEEISEMAHEADALFLLDAVTSLGGRPVEVDEWGVDMCYSGTQKCLSCPPGLSPVSFSSRAIEALNSRNSKVVSWYLDMSMVQKYWGAERVYHHTAPISAVYGLREGLRLIYEEGLEARFARHNLNHRALVAGLEAMGLKMLVEPDYRLPMLNAVCAPEGIEEAKVRKRVLERFGIEIGGGLGDFKGRIWRIGLMGESSKPKNVLLCLTALAETLIEFGFSPAGNYTAAADAVYAQ